MLSTTKPKLDELDIEIVVLLKRDGRSSNALMARKINVSEGTIRRRLKRLVKEQYIDVVAQPNYLKLGFDAQALVGIQVDSDKIDQVAQNLLASEYVVWVRATTGSFDLFAWVTLVDSIDLGNFLRDVVGVMTGVRRSETFVNLPAPWTEASM